MASPQLTFTTGSSPSRLQMMSTAGTYALRQLKTSKKHWWTEYHTKSTLALCTTSHLTDTMPVTRKPLFPPTKRWSSISIWTTTTMLEPAAKGQTYARGASPTSRLQWSLSLRYWDKTLTLPIYCGSSLAVEVFTHGSVTKQRGKCRMTCDRQWSATAIWELETKWQERCSWTTPCIQDSRSYIQCSSKNLRRSSSVITTC